MPMRPSQLGKRLAQEKELKPEESDVNASFQQRTCDCILNRGKDPLAFMVMEYCPSMDLFTYIADRATVGDEPLCHALFLQIVNTLNYMHDTHKMAHLDIKLENIVVDENYFLRLIDFAYCERVDAKMHISKGTERYLAPEVARIFYQRQVSYPNSLIE
jgi:serine/threonine protein kinase